MPPSIPIWAVVSLRRRWVWTMAIAQSAHEESMARYRIEHRTADATNVIAYSSDPMARQSELSQFAAGLVRDGLSGDIVLVDDESGEELARRSLVPDQPVPEPGGSK